MVRDTAVELRSQDDGVREAIIVPFSVKVQVVEDGTFEKLYVIVELCPVRTRGGVAVSVRSTATGHVLLAMVTGEQEAEALPVQSLTLMVGAYCPADA